MSSARWLITGASGQLGGHLVRRLTGETSEPAVLALVGQSNPPESRATVARVDLADSDALRDMLCDFAPTHILHVGAMTAVGDCYANPDAAIRVNVDATRNIAEFATKSNARLIYTSTDMVFNGDDAPYAEADRTNPLSHYGRTKLDAERALADTPTALVVRMPLMVGRAATPRATTFTKQMAALIAGEPLRLFTDEWRTPITLPDAARALIALTESDLTGVIHVAGPERLSRYEMIERCAAALGVDKPNLVATSRTDIDAPEPRPKDLSLDATRFTTRFPKLAPHPIQTAVLSPAH